MDARPAGPDDFAAIVTLYRDWDAAHFGQPEHDADEVRETFGDEADFAARSRLVFYGGRLVGAAWHAGSETTLLVAAGAGPDAYRDLLDWLATRTSGVDALATDEPARAALAERGWTHDHSSFELIRPVDGYYPAAPVWPAGIELVDFDPAQAEQIHRLIYVDAGWAEIPGHPERGFADWRRIFVTDKEEPAQQVVATRDGRIVGVSMGRIFSDGAGWVAQLAVAKSERGRGLGRALLLESLRRRIAAGAQLVGLSVEAVNRTAIGLYTDVGLTIDREWQKFVPPTA